MGAPDALRGDLVGTGFAGTARTVLAERYVTSKKNRHTRRSSGVVSWPTSFSLTNCDICSESGVISVI
jgi:hypothetical protein